MNEIEELRLKQLGDNMRFYGEMRFKQLTLLMAAMAAVGAGIAPLPPFKWWFALAGMLVTAVLWVMEVRSSLYGIAARNAAPELWPPAKPKIFPWLSATLAVLALHTSFYVFWLFCVEVWCRRCATFWVGVAVGICLLTFAGVNYWDNRDFWKPLDSSKTNHR